MWGEFTVFRTIVSRIFESSVWGSTFFQSAFVPKWQSGFHLIVLLCVFALVWNRDLWRYCFFRITSDDLVEGKKEKNRWRRCCNVSPSAVTVVIRGGWLLRGIRGTSWWVLHYGEGFRRAVRCWRERLGGWVRRRVVLMCAWEMQGCFEGRSVASLGLKEGNGEKGERLSFFFFFGCRWEKKRGKGRGGCWREGEGKWEGCFGYKDTDTVIRC